MRCAGRCGSVTRTRCPSCSPCRWTGGSSRTCLGSRATDPDNVPLLVERATRLTAARHYRAAQRDLERALRSDPAHADALAALGVVLSRKGLWSEAVPLLRRVVDSEPGRAIAWYRLGEALNKVDDLLGARAAYERAVELEPRNAKAL